MRRGGCSSPCGYHLDGAADLAAEVVNEGCSRPAPRWALDADAIVRPGPRLVEGVAAIAAILHPERAGRRPPAPPVASPDLLQAAVTSLGPQSILLAVVPRSELGEGSLVQVVAVGSGHGSR